MKNKAVSRGIILLMTVLLCIGMNALAFLFSPDSLSSNADQALTMLSIEGATPEAIGGYPSARLDNFTVALMIKTAAYNGPEPLMQKALGGKRIDAHESQDCSGWNAFCTYVDNRQDGDSGLSYARYWHGYTLPLRLLLSFFALPHIQMLLLFAQTTLFAWVCAWICRRCPKALSGFVCAFFFLMPSATGICLQYAPVTLLMLGACLCILTVDHAIDRTLGMPFCFLLIGLLTNYFDLLTFPLITLGFPLILLVCMHLHGNRTGGLLILSECLLCSLCWALGYGGMWALKWLLCAICFGGQYLSGILSQIALRTSTNSGGIAFSRLDAVRANLNILLSKSTYRVIPVFTVALIAFPAAVRVVRAGKHAALRVNPKALLLLLPALMPVIWILCLANHTLDHTYYTYRCITVSVLAILSCLPNLIICQDHTEHIP